MKKLFGFGGEKPQETRSGESGLVERGYEKRERLAAEAARYFTEEEMQGRINSAFMEYARIKDMAKLRTDIKNALEIVLGESDDSLPVYAEFIDSDQ